MNRNIRTKFVIYNFTWHAHDGTRVHAHASVQTQQQQQQKYAKTL